MPKTAYLDTETTGFNPEDGDRIVEIGIVEYEDRKPTGRTFHAYVNPGRPVGDSESIHKLSDEFLSQQPTFKDVARQMCLAIKGAEVVAHNAPFDVGFLNMEMERLAGARAPTVESLSAAVIDTLPMAKKKRGGRSSSLDALCKEYGISTAERDSQGHGALLDAKLLAEVHLALTREQHRFELNENGANDSQETGLKQAETMTVKVIPASPEETKRHEAFVSEIQSISGKAVWGKSLTASSSQAADSNDSPDPGKPASGINDYGNSANGIAAHAASDSQPRPQEQPPSPSVAGTSANGRADSGIPMAASLDHGAQGQVTNVDADAGIPEADIPSTAPLPEDADLATVPARLFL